MENFAVHIIKSNFTAALSIAAVLLTARIIKGKYTAQWKYFMWLVISASLLLPVNPFNFAAPLHLIIPAQNPAGFVQMQADGTASDQAAASHSPQSSNTDIAMSAGTDSGSPADTVSDKSAGSRNPSRFAPHSIVVYSKNVSLYGLLQLFMLLWCAGIFLLVIYRFVLYRFSLGTLNRWSFPENDRKILAIYQHACKKKQIARPPRLMVNPKITSPVLAGLRTTRLYLPANAYSLEELQLIFYHELSHYRSHDLWYKMLLLCITTVHWFNPMLYLMAKEAEKDIENLCDSRVIERCTQTEQQLYNRLLLKTATGQTHLPYLATSLNDSTLVFKERIHYMIKSHSLKKKVTPAILLSAVLLFSSSLIGCSALQPAPKTARAGNPNGSEAALPDSQAERSGLTTDAASGQRSSRYNRETVLAGLDMNTSAPADAADASDSPGTDSSSGIPDTSGGHNGTNGEGVSGVNSGTNRLGTSDTDSVSNASGTSWTGTTTGTQDSTYNDGTGNPSTDSGTAVSDQDGSGSGASSSGQDSSGSGSSSSGQDGSGSGASSSGQDSSGSGSSSSGTNADSPASNNTYSDEVIPPDDLPGADSLSRQASGTILTVDQTAFELQNPDGTTSWYWYDPNWVNTGNGSSELKAGDTIDITYYSDTGEVQNIY